MYKNLEFFEQKVALIDSGFKKDIEMVRKSLSDRRHTLEKICLSDDCKVNALAENLVNLKMFADNFPSLNESINRTIDKILKSYYEGQKDKGMALAKLSLILEKDTGSVGSTIISEHKIFKGESISLFNQAIKSQDIVNILGKLGGNEIDIEVLKSDYDQFDKSYKNLIEKYSFLKQILMLRDVHLMNCVEK